MGTLASDYYPQNQNLLESLANNLYQRFIDTGIPIWLKELELPQLWKFELLAFNTHLLHVLL
jgi:hypothetical protein